MGSPTLVWARPEKGLLIEVSWSAQQRIGTKKLEAWLEAFEVIMELMGVKSAYVSRRGFNIQVTFTWPSGAVDKWTITAKDRTRDQLPGS